MSNPVNKAIATGHAYIDYDPLNFLKHLRAQMGYRDGFCIYFTEAQKKRFDDVIAFNDGGDNAPKADAGGAK